MLVNIKGTQHNRFFCPQILDARREILPIFATFVPKTKRKDAKCGFLREEFFMVYNNPYSGNQQNAIFTAQQTAEIEIQTTDTKNWMSIQKAQALSEISVLGSAQRDMNAADIASRRQLQKTTIAFSADNYAILQKECFGENLKGRLPIQILRAIIFQHESDMEKKVLYLQVKKDNNDECIIYWNVKKNENRWIRKVFEINGISFGFNEKKENEIRKIGRAHV